MTISPGIIILLALFAFAVFLVLLKKYLDWIWKLAGKGIEQRHRTAYFILETGRIPARWIRRFSKRGRLDTPKDRARAKNIALKMLDGYIRYFDRSAPFDTLEAKRAFMNSINRVRERWSKASEREIPDLIELPGGMVPWRSHGPSG